MDIIGCLGSIIVYFQVVFGILRSVLNDETKIRTTAPLEIFTMVQLCVYIWILLMLLVLLCGDWWSI